MKIKKGFTIIELIVGMAILGIIVLLAMPRFMYYNEKAFDASVKADLKTVQTTVDVKVVDNGGVSPYEIEIGDAKELDVNTLKPKYLKSLSLKDGYEFWIDGWDNVYYNGIYPPEDVTYKEGKLSWNEVENAKEYNVYIVSDKKEVSLLELIGVQTVFADSIESRTKKELYKITKDLSIDVPEGTYLVSAVGKNTESVAVGENFVGGFIEEDIEAEEKESEIPEELKNIEDNGKTLIKVNPENFEGVEDKNTLAKDSLTKAIELSSNGDGFYLNKGVYNTQSNDVFWSSPYKKYSSIVLRKSLTLIGENTEKTILKIDDSNSIKPSDGSFFAITFNAPDITLKNMTIHIDQDSIQSLDSIFNVWGQWDGTTSRNLTLENITVIIDSPVNYLFYMNDYNLTVKNMKVVSNGNLRNLFYWNYGNATIIDSNLGLPIPSDSRIKIIDSNFK